MPGLRPPTAMQVYEEGLGRCRAAAAGHFHVVGDDGSRRRLPLERWLRRPAAEEEELLRRAAGPVLDVGCGVGRHVVSLRARGIAATGVEISALAAAIARERRAVVIEGSIFDLSLEKGWATALLLDGNIGIGGDPERLLARVAGLLGPGGSVLVELEPPRTPTGALRLRLEGAREVSEWVPWAWVGADAIEGLARTAGLATDEVWSVRSRWFARLTRETGA